MNKYLTIPGAEPFFIKGGKTGCLLLHGFTGTPREMRMLGDSLAADGFTVLAPRLFAHATDPKDMPRARLHDWLASAEDSLNLLKGCTERQFVMGLSMGGILTMIMASRYEIAGAVSFSTPSELPAAPWKKFALPILGYLNLHFPKGKPDWHNLEAAKYHLEYPYFPTRAVLELNKLIDMMGSELPNVRVPLMIVQSKADLTVPLFSMNYLYDQVSSIDKTRLWVENSGHVVTCEPDRESIFFAVKSFIRRIEKSG